MAISTYAELQTAVQNWMDDTSLSARVPEWIALAEDRINGDLGTIRKAWTSTTLTGTPSSRSLTLPTGFIEPRALYLTTSGEEVYLHPFVNGTAERRTSNGTPVAWCINGDNIDLDCPLSAADTFLFYYRARWDIASTSTNWLLTNHPSVYFSAAMVEAGVFRDDDNGAVKWETRYQQAVDRVTTQEARNLSVAPLQVDAALIAPPTWFNYSTG